MPYVAPLLSAVTLLARSSRGRLPLSDRALRDRSESAVRVRRSSFLRCSAYSKRGSCSAPASIRLSCGEPPPPLQAVPPAVPNSTHARAHAHAGLLVGDSVWCGALVCAVAVQGGAREHQHQHAGRDRALDGVLNPASPASCRNPTPRVNAEPGFSSTRRNKCQGTRIFTSKRSLCSPLCF